MADFTPHEAPARTPRALPVMLPHRLIGRDVTLARVYSQLKGNHPVLVYGAAGIGKTALAATLASAYSELPGGSLWLRVNNPPLAELIVRVGRAYQSSEITSSENPLNAVGATATLLAAQRPLVILDGAISDQVASDFITRCAPGLPVLLVNDDELVGSWNPLRLGKLEPDQSATLFRQMAELDDEDSLVPPDVNDADINGLMSALNYTPFAIAVAAGAVRGGQTPADFLASLPQVTNGANAQLLALTAAFRGLNNALQGLLLVLGVTPRGQGSAELIGMIGSAPADSINGAMNLLVQRHLVERFDRYDRPYYRLHPLTQTFTQSWLRGSGRLDALQAKVRDSLLEYARQNSGDHDRLAAEMENFVALAQNAADAGDRDVANQCAVALLQAGDFVNARGYVYELLLLRRLAAPATGAFPAYGTEPPVPAGSTAPLPFAEEDEDEDLIEVEDDLDDEDEYTGGYDPIDLDEEEDEAEDDFILPPDSPTGAPLTAAAAPPPAPTPPLPRADLTPAHEITDLVRLRSLLVQARQAGDRRRQVDLLTQIGRVQANNDATNEAIGAYTEAISIYETLNDSAGLLMTLEALSDLTAAADTPEVAVLYSTRGVALAEQLDRDASRLKLLMTLGDARQELGEDDQAIRAYTQAAEVARKLEDPRQEAMALFKNGFAQLDNGQAEEAIRTWEMALPLFRAQNRRDYEGRTLGALGTANGELERWSEAINLHTSALHIARELKNTEEEALQLSSLGYAAEQARQLGQAVLRYRQALHLAYQSSSRANIVSATVDLVRLLVESPRHLRIAEMLVNEALAVDGNDRDLKRLKERVQDELEAQGDDVPQAPVGGSARQYAANGYALLNG